MADEDQRAARKAEVAGGDRRDAKRRERSNDSGHEQMDSRIRSKGIRFLEAPSARHRGQPPGRSRRSAGLPRDSAALTRTASLLPCMASVAWSAPGTRGCSSRKVLASAESSGPLRYVKSRASAALGLSLRPASQR